MGAATLEHVNAMPAPTWHRLQMNDAAVALPAGLTAAHDVAVEGAEGIAGAPGAFEAALAALAEAVRAQAPDAPDGRAVLKAIEPGCDPHDLDIPAVSAYQARAAAEEQANDAAAAFELGMGAEATAYLAAAAGEPLVIAPQPGAPAEATVRVAGVDGAANAAAIDVVAAPGASLRLTVALDSPQAGAGVVGAQLRIAAGAGARVEVTSVHTLGEGWTALDNTGIILDEGAHVSVNHRTIGGGKSYVGLASDLRGDASRLAIDTRYLAAGEQERDFNYVIRHRGRKSTCEVNANGVLMGASKKTFRGTIDLVHGCKGSEGSEQETVLLVDERVENKTIPVILCDEDDVAGNHGATIGHVRPSQLFYLGCRGLSPEAAEGLFATATLEETALLVDDAPVRAGVARLAEALHIPYEPQEVSA